MAQPARPWGSSQVQAVGQCFRLFTLLKLLRGESRAAEHPAGVADRQCTLPLPTPKADEKPVPIARQGGTLAS